MPDKKFLEEYPLYRKFKIDWLPCFANQLGKVAINMYCAKCCSDQTFVMTNNYFENCKYENYPMDGLVIRLVYICMHCREFLRFFLVKVSEKRDWLMKVGQFPPWDITGNKDIDRLLRNHYEHYRKGLICESQAYGIGALAYYRRIVEVIIDSLLDEIVSLMSGEELLKYQEALRKSKETTVAQEKIDLVKDLLPPILRPDGINPLGVLHKCLSEGLHAETDEDCLESACLCREALIFLVSQIEASRIGAKKFTESMRKLLDKKTKNQN